LTARQFYPLLDECQGRLTNVEWATRMIEKVGVFQKSYNHQTA